jgi:hypothetical protein
MNLYIIKLCGVSDTRVLCTTKLQQHIPIPNQSDQLKRIYHEISSF